MDEDTVYKLEKGRYPLLLQMTAGDMEGFRARTGASPVVARGRKGTR
jgi:hypothetical protein